KSARAKAPPILECRLTAERSHVAGEGVPIRFALRNVSPKPVSVLSWQTPLEGILGDIFRVVSVDGGEPLPYQGPMVKRAAPDADDYVRIAPRGEVAGEVDAAAAYELARPGRYLLSFRGPILDVIRKGDPP